MNRNLRRASLSTETAEALGAKLAILLFEKPADAAPWEVREKWLRRYSKAEARLKLALRYRARLVARGGA